MLSLLFARWAEAYRNPRRSARRLLAATPTPGEAVVLALAGFAISALASRLIEMGLGVTLTETMARLGEASEEDIAAAVANAKSLGALGQQFIIHVFEFLTASVLGWRLGVAAGGTAKFGEVMGLAGWWLLASAPIQALAQFLLLVSAPGLMAVGMLVLLGAWLYVMYLFAAFLAEAHGFESEAVVFVSQIGVLFGIALLTVLVIGGGVGGA